jgi:TRAP-type C4-dicarboxylate transport system substrate-binding protein
LKSSLIQSARSAFAIGAVLPLMAIATTNPASAVDLVYGAWPPAVEYVNAKAMPKLAREVEAETRGTIKWKIIGGG